MTTSVNVYHATIKSCKYIFKDGTVANFVNGKFPTTLPQQIEELDKVVAAGHPHIHVRKGEEVVDYDTTDPLAELRKKFFNEFKAEQAQAAANPTTDFGTSTQGPLKGTSTTDIAAVTIGAAKK